MHDCSRRPTNGREALQPLDGWKARSGYAKGPWQGYPCGGPFVRSRAALGPRKGERMAGSEEAPRPRSSGRLTLEEIRQARRARAQRRAAQAAAKAEEENGSE